MTILNDTVDRALKEALQALWFEDNSDYETALYQVASILAGQEFNDPDDVDAYYRKHYMTEEDPS